MHAWVHLILKTCTMPHMYVISIPTVYISGSFHTELAAAPTASVPNRSHTAFNKLSSLPFSSSLTPLYKITMKTSASLLEFGVFLFLFCCCTAYIGSKQETASAASHFPLPSHSPVPLRRQDRMSTEQEGNFWCDCKQKYVADEGTCYPCPYPESSVSPTPDSSYTDPATYYCNCKRAKFEVEGPEVTCPDGCTPSAVAGKFGGRSKEVHCSCLGRAIENPRECCWCERARCKCWHSWWKAKKYQGHFCRSRCSSPC